MIVKLNNVRLAFPDLFTAVAFEAGQEPKFGATFLIPKSSPLVKEIEKAIIEVAALKWTGGKHVAILESIKTQPNKYCFTNGDSPDKAKYDGYAGCMALSAKSASRPLVVDRDRSILAAGDGKPYAGCYVNTSVEIWAQDNKWGKGMRASLRGVQFYKDGDAFGGGSPASVDEFDDLGEGADAEADLV